MPALAVTPDVLDQGRSVLEAAFGRQRTVQVKTGPPQPPWEELQGVTFTREMVGDLTPDELGRDDFSTDQRVRAFDWLMAAYELNRHRPVFPPIWQPPGLYILSGDQGDGKTMVAVDIGTLFVICGWPSYSVNGGLCFGKTMKRHQVYSFCDYVTRGSFTFGDEIHAIYGRYESQTVRGMTMAQGTAGFRKEFIWCFGATSREWMIGGDLKAAVRGVGYPFQDYPAGGKFDFPPWAYRGVEWYYPDPWRGQQYREIHNRERQHREPCLPGNEYCNAASLYRAAQHYVSWEQIITDFGGKLGADTFRNAQDSDRRGSPGEEAVGLHVLGWVEDGVFQEELLSAAAARGEGRSLLRGPHILHLTDLAARYESETGFKVGVAKLGRSLRAVGAEPSSRERISVLTLLDAVVAQKKGTAAAVHGKERV